MRDFTLIIGNKNYSTWSLRPWLALKMAGIPFEEEKVYLYTDHHKSVMAPFLPAKTVPILKDGDIMVSESLAICDYLHDLYPEKSLWPADKASRAVARMAAAEMACSYMPLRRNCPMDWRGGVRKTELTPETLADIARIELLWDHCFSQANRPEGNFLLGEFSIADAMHAPLAIRFHLHGVKVNDRAQAYVDFIINHPLIKEWAEDAVKETMIIDFSKGWPPFSYDKQE